MEHRENGASFDRANQKKFDLKAFFGLINRTKPAYWQLWLGLALGLIATAIQLAVPHFAKTLINGFTGTMDKGLLISVIGLFILSAVISAISGTILGFFGENVVSKIRTSLWDKLVRLRVPYFDETKAGEMTSRLINDSTQIKDLLANAFPKLITSALTVVGALVLMIMMDWRMTAVMFLAIPLVMLIMLPLGRRAGKVGHDRQDALADFNGSASETLGEIRLVKSSNAEIFELTSGHKQIGKLYQIGLREAIYDSIAGPLMTAVMMGLFIGVLAYGAHRVSQGTMSMGTMFSFLMYLFQLLSPAVMVGQFFTELAKASGATERVHDLLLEEEEDFASGDIIDVEGKTLAMAHVDFAYDDTKQILTDVSFEAKPNTVVAFAGPSGGGKSTLFGLLERYYNPTAGKILLGGQDAKEIQLDNWRRQIGFVSQDSAIMAGTIRYNLTYGLDDDYSDERLWEVLRLAYAEKFVRDMPDALDTEVGERGVKVSGGQRQRLAIARAFLRDPKILMLDEATASLDSESEAMVQKALTQLMQGRTTLVIAHRLSTIVDADMIYFIEQGHVSGSGTHQELVASHELYRDYVATQFNQD